ncbi:hypothetical protein QLQ15_13240 [Lysobacter sp. LF1]|uniref:Uncharacterized protein n=1 Tax=Lysobacter stagni TaxID=3045172 RepID=A0ABT6XJC9_9GAMM|nr:hypothetical protein [Lysobacter sp. LF1]MDI9239870.1 hypothetical protein [Lysobacter sp. LF1]
MVISSDYAHDSIAQLSIAAGYIKANMNNDERTIALVFSAIGIEKLLKFVIAEVNPSFVLKSQDFESTVLACHRDQVAAERIGDIESKAKTDVLTMRAAVQRASFFSAAARKHSQVIHALADARDIAVHRPTRELDVAKVDVLLTRDIYRVVEDVSCSTTLSIDQLLGGHRGRLSNLSRQIAERDNVQAKVKALLAESLELWAGRQTRGGVVEGAEAVTQKCLSMMDNAVSCVCPACGNKAIAYVEPDWDFDADDQVVYATGVSVREIKCFYCSLMLDEYDELQYVRADELIKG